MSEGKALVDICQFDSLKLKDVKGVALQKIVFHTGGAAGGDGRIRSPWGYHLCICECGVGFVTPLYPL